MEIVLMVLLGLTFGSFINVLIYRLPRGEQVIRGRSHCPHCNHELAWYYLVPLVSWLGLGGRCRYCQTAISWRYPLVELVIAGLLVGLVSIQPDVFSNPLLLLGWVIIICGLLAILIIDFQHWLIPDKILIVLVIAGGALQSPSTWPSHLAAALLVGCFFWLAWQLSHKRGLGLGDVKLVAVLGWIFGPAGTVWVVYGALLLGCAWGLTLLISRRGTLKSKLPFGTILALVALIYIYTSTWWPDWLAQELELIRNLWI